MTTYHFETYRIKLFNDDGSGDSMEIRGTIVGPFGIAESTHATEMGSMYAVTHLHSGLSIRQLKSSCRDRCISAAKELFEEVDWWASHKPSRISEAKGKTVAQLKSIVEAIAIKHGCEGIELEEQKQGKGEEV